jgi:hypothetical protein
MTALLVGLSVTEPEPRDPGTPYPAPDPGEPYPAPDPGDPVDDPEADELAGLSCRRPAGRTRPRCRGRA